MIVSVKIAEALNTNHRDLLVKIRKLNKEVVGFEKGVQESTYEGINGRKYKCFLLKEQNVEFLVKHHKNRQRDTLKKIKESS